ncbi:MAG: efflux RND transporter periplasmic adaptor subunit [Nitrospirae bacterium]|nr:MAG: efflux RND transporter periplasmic adaptor subunit [Nitrospirota bacterium]
MPKLKKTFRTLLILLVAAGVAAALVRVRLRRMRQLAAVPPPAARPWAVHTAPVVRGTATRGFPALATLTASREITLTGQIAGTLVEMGPREGVRVHRGELLARVDTRELEATIAAKEARLAAAKAAAARATAEYAREQRLMKEGGSDASKVEEWRTAKVAAEEEVASLEREIAALRVRLGYARITAPADGVIAARLAEPGDLCQPGKPLYRLTVSHGARLRVDLPQSILEQVHPGTPVVLSHGSARLEVRITRVHPALDPRALGSAEADLARPPFGLPSGARVPARILLARVEEALIVPPRALLLQDPGHGRLFKVVGEGPAAHLAVVPVAVGLHAHEGWVVRGPVAAGDRVVVAHESVLAHLHDGDPVVVVDGLGTGAPAPPAPEAEPAAEAGR